MINKILKRKYYVPYEWMDIKGNKWTGSVSLEIFRFARIDPDNLKEEIKSFIIKDTGRYPEYITILSINKL